MNEGSIVLYLTKKGLAAVEIYEDLVATVGLEVISYPSVMGYLREAKFATLNPEVTFSQPIREHDNYSQTILLAFDEQPFASVRQLARLTHLPQSIGFSRSLWGSRFVISDGFLFDSGRLKSQIGSNFREHVYLTRNSVGQFDVNNYLESQWFLRHQYSFKRDQIQRRPLYYRCASSIGGMADHSCR
jgi:hypothetical protein